MKSILKRTILIASLALVSVSSFTSQAANVCRDDPRMFTIKTVLDDMEAGKPVEPMKLTPLTFLELTENVRKKLGDNIRVYDNNCIPTQIYEGQVAKPIYLPFGALEQGLHTAAMRGDKKTLDAIFQQFRAEPKSAYDIVQMARPITWTKETTDFLYQVGKMEKTGLESFDGYDEAKACGGVLSPITQVELFSKLGGKANNRDDILFYTYRTGKEYGYSTISKEHIEHTLDILFIGSDNYRCSSFSYSRTTNAMARTGLNIVNIKEDLKSALDDYKKDKLNNKL